MMIHRATLSLILSVSLGATVGASEWGDRLDEAQARQVAQRRTPENGIVLVADGQPMATLVHGADGDEAAALLNTWIELMSDVTLPVSATPPGQGAAVYLGRAALDAGLSLENIESATDEALGISTSVDKVLIGFKQTSAGGRAVGRFLEEAFGCRWLATTAWGRMYPRSRNLRVRSLDIKERPTMDLRNIWGARGAFRDLDWGYWNGKGGRGVSMSHSWHFMEKVDFEQHPDWFRMNAEGDRVKGPWPNLGNIAMRKFFVAEALAASEDGRKTISLSPPDSYRFDHSPEATAYDNPNVVVPTSGMVSMTDRFIGVINEAAWAIHAKGHGGQVGFYAYSDYTFPPTKPEFDKLAPNLCIWIAPIRFSRYHPIGHPNSRSRQELANIITGWAKRAAMIGYRTYNYNLAELQTPFSKLGVWSRDIPYLHKHQCVGINFESMDSWQLSAPHLYLSIQLAYDPTRDPRTIIADYMVAAYGAAAPAMLDYWLALDQAWVNQHCESGSIHALPQVFTHNLLTTLDAHLARAEQAVANEVVHAPPVAVARRGWERAMYWRRWFDALNCGDVAAASAIVANWQAALKTGKEAGDVNTYELIYHRRFIASITAAANLALKPEDHAVRRIIVTLPDQWKYATGEYAGMDPSTKPWDVRLDDHAWPAVATFSATLNAQGYDEYFGDMWYRCTVAVPDAAGPFRLHVVKADRKLTVFINGHQVNEQAVEAFNGATLDVSEQIIPGKSNQITLKIRHVPLPELFLGGLVAPVYLIQGL